EDQAEIRRSAIGAYQQLQGSHDSWLEQRCNGHSTRWLNDDFHAFPDQPRRRNDLFLAYEEDTIHVAPQDRKRSRRQRSAQAVGDGVAGVLRLQRTSGQRAIGVIRALWLAAKHADIC